ncbi:caspase [Elysia marginata]|uniref:Caspase n=1 Tax=Elysia marginata TaxID=1093978 RepID=A0AAV4GZX3_9GAST|nr:caspase [Elysia marginata]
MEQHHRDLLRSNHMELIQYLKSEVSLITTALYAKGVITESMYERILTGNSNDRDRASQLLHLIATRGKNAFKMFYELVRDAQLHLAADLLRPDQSPHEENHPSERQSLDCAFLPSAPEEAPPSYEELYGDWQPGPSTGFIEKSASSK